MDERKKLKMHIKGNVYAHVYELYHGLQVLRHGIKTHEVRYHGNASVEILVEGDKSSLWNFIHTSRKGPMFCRIEELSFQFVKD